MALPTIAGLAGFAMSTVGGWVGCSVVDNFVSEAYSYLHDRMLPADCEAELQRLQLALPQIMAVMDIAEALKMRHPSAGPWVDQFRGALEASEDMLDELEYKRLENMVKTRDEEGGSASCSKKQKSCPVSDDTLKRLREVVRMLDQAAAGVGSLLQFATVLSVRDLSESFIQANKVLRRETSSILVETKVFGRGVEKSKIISWLNRSTEGPLSSFGIVGIGGVGKTTLAQLAYQEMKGSNHFDRTIWVCVSVDFSVEGVTRKILGELGDSSSSSDKPLNALQECLKEKVLSKKILFILDDVWDDQNRECWEQFIAPLRCAKEGSKILFTTRMESVCNLLTNVINTKHESLVLEGLEEQQLRLLFSSYAFRGSNSDNHSDLEAIGNQIVKMLRGSPLAAKVIGSLLNSQLDYHFWTRILNHDSLFKIDQAKKVIEVLKLSYYHLPADLQVCFRFCSIFPRDHEFDKDDLIKMWIAAGFILQGSYQERPEDIGEDYFNHLLRKSFFEYSQSRAGRYVMHDLIHELSQNVSFGECCRVESNDKLVSIPSSVRHISVQYSEIERISHLRNLRSLIITTTFRLSHEMKFLVLPDSLIKKTLRLIKINGTHECKLPEEMGCLLHLRYLSIELKFHMKRSFKHLLPASIYNLYHLQVLDISAGFCSSFLGIETTGMTNLVSLRSLSLPDEIMQTISGVHKLTSLQELTFFIGHGSGHGINELGTLNNLRHLCIENIENVGDPAEAKCVNLLEKDHLISLSLKWSSESNPNNPEQILDCLQPHPELRELKIENYKGQRSPSWMEHTSPLKLASLKLLYCPVWKNQFLSWQMPVLKILEIHNCPNLDELPYLPLSLIELRLFDVGMISLPYLYQSFGSNSSQSLLLKSSLREVEIETCPNLIALNGFLQQENLNLQALEKFMITDCENLELIPLDAFRKLSSLQYLAIDCCPNLTNCPTLPLSLTEFEMIEVGVSDLPKYYESSNSSRGPSTSSLRSMSIWNCQNLTSLSEFLEQENVNFQALEYITISNCTNFSRLPELPPSLRSLIITGAKSLKSLPSTMANLTALINLKITNADLLKRWELPELPASLADKSIRLSNDVELLT